MQIRKIGVVRIKIDEDLARLIGKCISNDGDLVLWDCEITKPAFGTFCVALGDKHVIIS